MTFSMRFIHQLLFIISLVLVPASLYQCCADGEGIIFGYKERGYVCLVFFDSNTLHQSAYSCGLHYHTPFTHEDCGSSSWCQDFVNEDSGELQINDDEMNEFVRAVVFDHDTDELICNVVWKDFYGEYSLQLRLLDKYVSGVHAWKWAASRDDPVYTNWAVDEPVDRDGQRWAALRNDGHWYSEPSSFKSNFGGFCVYDVFMCSGFFSTNSSVCSGRGECSDVGCTCNEGYFGVDCEFARCYGIPGNDETACGNGDCFYTDTCDCVAVAYEVDARCAPLCHGLNSFGFELLFDDDFSFKSSSKWVESEILDSNNTISTRCGADIEFAISFASKQRQLTTTPIYDPYFNQHISIEISFWFVLGKIGYDNCNSTSPSNANDVFLYIVYPGEREVLVQRIPYDFNENEGGMLTNTVYLEESSFQVRMRQPSFDDGDHIWSIDSFSIKRLGERCSGNGVCEPNSQCICGELYSGEFCQCYWPETACCGRGSVNEGCTACECHTGDWDTSTNCSSCSMWSSPVCNLNGNPNDDCTACDCENSWDVASNCSICSVWSPSACNERGNPNSDCTGCICDNDWDIFSNCSTCSEWSSKICNDHGAANSDCKGCICNNTWDISSNCSTCSNWDFSCSPNGHASANCSGCSCTNHWDVSTNCSTCSLWESSCLHGNANSLCSECNCSNSWDAFSNCTTCTLWNSQVCNERGSSNIDCSGCDCENDWDKNSNCLLCHTWSSEVCNDHGSRNNDCTACFCQHLWDISSNCSICHLSENDCSFHGVPNEECSNCKCVSDWDVETRCETCSSWSPLVCNNRGKADANCSKCDCEEGFEVDTNCLTWRCGALRNVDDTVCSSFGICVSPQTCKCFQSFGEYCEITIPEEVSSENFTQIVGCEIIGTESQERRLLFNSTSERIIITDTKDDGIFEFSFNLHFPHSEGDRSNIVVSLIEFLNGPEGEVRSTVLMNLAYEDYYLEESKVTIAYNTQHSHQVELRQFVFASETAPFLISGISFKIGSARPTSAARTSTLISSMTVLLVLGLVVSFLAQF